MRRVSTEGPRTPVGDHFILREFQCNDGTDILLLHPVLTNWLNRLRSWAGKPVRVNSGFRTHAYNREIGGAKKSKHLLGMAADVFVIEQQISETRAWAREQDFGGIGLYNSFTHLDVFGQNRRWDKR